MIASKLARLRIRPPAALGYPGRLVAAALWAACLSACGGSDSRSGDAGHLWYAGTAICAFTEAQLKSSGGTNPAIRVTSAAAPGGFSDLAHDAAGNVWAVDTAGKQLLRFSAAAVRASGAATPDLVLRSRALHDPGNIVVDDRGNLWVANRATAANPSTGGILRFDDPGGLVGSHEVDASLQITARDPGDLFILGAMTFDPPGNLWATSYAGILRFDDPRGLQGDVTLAPDAVIRSSGYLPDSVHFFMIAFDPGGALWAAAQTTGFHLTSVMKFTDAMSLSGVSSPAPAVTITGEPDLLPAGGLAFDREGHLWLATADAILQYVNPGELSGKVNPDPDVRLSVFNEASPSLYGHLVFSPTRR